MGPSSPFPKGDRALPPIFGPCLLSPNCWMDQDGTWHGGGPRSRPRCDRWGSSSPSPKRGQSPRFLAHFYCGQMAGCIKSYCIVSHCECKQLPLYAHIYVRNIINDTITLRITSTSSSKEWCFKVIHNILVKPKLM